MNSMGNFTGLLGGLGGFPGATHGMTGQTPLQGMGLGSPFFANRPTQVSQPQQGFNPTRWESMAPQSKGLLGMSNNFPNLVGPTSALPADQQAPASQLRMWGMEDQMAQPTPEGPGGPAPTATPEEIFQTLVDARAMVPTPPGYSGGNDYRIIGPDGRDYWSNEQWQNYWWDSNQGGG